MNKKEFLIEVRDTVVQAVALIILTLLAILFVVWMLFMGPTSAW